MQIVLARFHPNGAFDRRFANRGVERSAVGKRAQAFDTAVQPDGRIVLAGQLGPRLSPRYAVLRYKPNGGLDQSFFGDGVLARRFARGDNIALASEALIDRRGRVVTAGASLSTGPESKLVVGRILP